MFIGKNIAMNSNGGCVSSKRKKRDGSVVRGRRGQRKRYTRSAISRGGGGGKGRRELFKREVNRGGGGGI